MDTLNIITGLPRSGSTLLCNILNQNPEIYASSTSILGGIIKSISASASEQLETVGYLMKDDGFYERLKDSTRAFVSSYHPDKIVFEKGRVWSSMGLQYKDLYPEGLMIVMVRDLRDVYASMEKQHRKQPLLQGSSVVSDESVYGRADKMFSPEGMIGSCMNGIEDLIRRKLPNVVFIQYEVFANNPNKTIETIYDLMKQPNYEHDTDNVVNVSEEVDELYQGKYPHNGEGKVSSDSIGTWREYLSPDLAASIKNRFPLYAETFGYN